MVGINDVNRHPVIHTWSYKLADAPKATELLLPRIGAKGQLHECRLSYPAANGSEPLRLSIERHFAQQAGHISGADAARPALWLVAPKKPKGTAFRGPRVALRRTATNCPAA